MQHLKHLALHDIASLFTMFNDAASETKECGGSLFDANGSRRVACGAAPMCCLHRVLTQFHS